MATDKKTSNAKDGKAQAASKKKAAGGKAATKQAAAADKARGDKARGASGAKVRAGGIDVTLSPTFPRATITLELAFEVGAEVDLKALEEKIKCVQEFLEKQQVAYSITANGKHA